MNRMIDGSRGLFAAGALVVAAVLAPGAQAQTTADKAREAGRETKQEAREVGQDTKQAAKGTGNAISDSWITMKVHAQFVPEDVLEDSDIDVETRKGVVTLMGTVPTAAGKSRAVAIARATDGVKNVADRLRVVPGSDDDDGKAVGAAGAAAREGARDTKATTRQAGRGMSDGWVTSKIYADFIDEDALEGSDIDVDVEKGVVTLTGTVPTRAGSDRAAAVAKAIDGVTSVRNNLKVRAQK
ncbi:molecular chaperone OsmY [Luteitalea sp. TBR-22]|uniref:BON domain-containing protein n=1 Tax=Luteitalea sp. TBR-22 TaxID=2802971 RepID=UPI001AF88C3F|nr:BON domain-containing protein [Luteitalea sp. TBR-22]BCS32208.1 molecular chaperone OsmY [Luteitalea sp. TBR-22]